MSAPVTALRGLYAITSAGICESDARLLQACRQALRGGARLLQYRDKLCPPDRRRMRADALLRLCRDSGVPLIVNDDMQLAAELGADGVHLGQADGSLQDARTLLGPGAIIGISCANSLDRALAAQAGGASYVAFGALSVSTTKPLAPRMSLETLLLARAQLHLPICAIGGLTPENAGPVIAAGADSIAVVEGLFGASDVAATATRYARLFEAGQMP